MKTDARKIWLSSDWHLDHPNILSLQPNRPFANIIEMEDKILDNVNFLVQENDVLYLLGDICLGNKNRWDNILDKIICKNICLIQGNHDTWKNIPKSKVIFTAHSILLRAFHHYFLLCHFPYRAAWWKVWAPSVIRKDPRRPKDKGFWLLHGHDHRPTPFCNYHPRMLNVGVDAWDFKPINIATIFSMIQKKKIDCQNTII